MASVKIPLEKSIVARLRLQRAFDCVRYFADPRVLRIRFAPAPDIEQDKRRDEESKVHEGDESTGNGNGSSGSDPEKKEI